MRLDSRRPPALGGFNLTFIWIEIRRLLRNRRTMAITIMVPVLMVILLFRGGRRLDAVYGSDGQAFLMIGFAVYGAMLGATAGGAMVSVERTLGWSRQLRLTPLRPAAYIAIKLLTAMFLGLVSVLAVYVAGALSGVRMTADVWILSGALAWLGGLVFAAFGLFMGYLLPTENVMQFIAPVLAGLAIVGGLFVPLNLLPSTIQDVAPFTPTYGVAAIAREPLLRIAFDGTWVLNVVAWSLAFATGAALLFSRDTRRT